jgi:hypothetical protein
MIDVIIFNQMYRIVSNYSKILHDPSSYQNESTPEAPKVQPSEKTFRDANTFSFQSDYRIAVNEANDKDLIDSSNQLLENMEKKHTELVYTDDGTKIINAYEDRTWFAKNIAFIFAMGRIYDHDDEINMDNILRMFDDKNNMQGTDGRFLNYFKILPFTDSQVKKIESRVAVGNGNYHIMCFIVVTAKEDQLESSPEFLFSKRGVVLKLASWNDIHKFLNSMMIKYGLLPERPAKDIAQKKPTTTLGNNQTLAFDTEFTKEQQDLQAKEIEFQNELRHDYKIRTRNTHRTREQTGELTRIRDKKSLFSRIHTPDLDAVPLLMKGVESKTMGRFMPNIEKEVDYETFDKESYIDGKGIVTVDRSIFHAIPSNNEEYTKMKMDRKRESK